jgi:hypothetical protein
MGLSLHFPKFLKNTFAHKQDKDQTSPASSINNQPVSNYYIRDPMRCGSHPDVVGYYYDPMGGKYSRYQGTDATNTGA